MADLATFQRLLDLSTRALDALENADVDRLVAVLAEREDTIAAAAELGSSTEMLTVANSAPLLRAARDLERADARLALAIAARRDEIGHHLDTLDSRGAARSAYGPRSRARSTINLVR